MAYVWITCAHRSETDLYFRLWQDKNVMQSFSAHMHRIESMQVCSHTLLIVKPPDYSFKESTKLPDFFSIKTWRDTGYVKRQKLPAPSTSTTTKQG